MKSTISLPKPAPSHTAFVERVSRPGGKPLPPRAESAYRTLGEWRRIVTTHRATHLGPLRPGNAAVLVDPASPPAQMHR